MQCVKLQSCQKKIKQNLWDLSLGQVLNLDTGSKSIKGQFDILELKKIKNFFFVKDPVKLIKRKDIHCEKIFASHMSGIELVYRTYKELSKLNNKEI